MKKRSEKDKKKAISFPAFVKYRDDLMTERERNAFERELQSDPFTDDAMEGFESITADEARHDMRLLRNRLGSSGPRSRRYLYYTAAASVAVLALLSTVILLITRDKSSIVLSENYPAIEPIVIVRPEAITKSTSSGKVTSPGPAVEKKRQTVTETSVPAASAPVSARVDEIQRIDADNAMINDTPAYRKAFNDTGLVKDNRKFTPVALREKAAAEFVALHDTSAAAIDEVTHLDYARSLREDDPTGTPVDHIPPEPLPGKAEFNKYLKDNIKIPAGETGGQRVVVVAGFTVNRDGSIDSIRIIRSPSNTYSEEVIRLIKEGPPWKPAMENGLKRDEEVRIRIVFR